MVKKYPIVIVVLFILLAFFFIFFIKILLSNKDYSYDLIQVDYKTSKIIHIKNKLPVSDKIGKSFTGEGTSDGIQGYIELSLTNPNTVSVSYDIILTEDLNLESSRINSNYIKIYLTDNNDIPFDGFNSRKIPTFHELGVLKDKPESRLLYRGYLNPEEVKNIKLRVWLSDSYSISASSSSKEKEFYAEIKVRDNRRIYEG